MFIFTLILKNTGKEYIRVSTKKKKTILILRINIWAANQYIRMISEGSCDTEDWSNDVHHITIIYNIITVIKLHQQN